MTTTPLDTVRSRFFAPLDLALKDAEADRQCPRFSDREHLVSGISRVIEIVQSGRDWVQLVRCTINATLSVSVFFQSLRSKRRLALTEQVSVHVCQQLDTYRLAKMDPLAAHPELKKFRVYASDGHYEKAAAHTPPVEGEVVAPGCFYSINLRSHSMTLLDVARPLRKKEHDMHALKRMSAEHLRMGAPKGVKVIHVYDCAAIDYAQWLKWKGQGIYLISREKENSKAYVVGLPKWDRDDPRNIGVLAYEMVAVFSGLTLYRVRYQDPATGTIFSFLTNEFTLPPGLIAFLYKLRWDIEKVFDEKKNKLLETKAWGTTYTARCQQAHFFCLSHNLMLLLERDLALTEGVEDEKVRNKRHKRLEELRVQINQSGRQPNPMVMNCVRITQRSLQFIRWLRSSLRTTTSWRDGVEALRPLMAAYLT